MSAARKQGESPDIARDPAPQQRSARSRAPLRKMLRGAGNNAISGLVQAKLRVGHADDPLEAEADKAAATLGGGCCAGKAHGERCDDCVQRKERESSSVPRSASEFLGAAPSPRNSEAPRNAEELASRALSGTGTPLDAQTRAEMESHFDADLGDVRVHTGGEASSSADAIGAHAYTSGRDVVFSGGAYQPRGSDGRRLLAHELAHVLQQRGHSDRTLRREEKKKPPPSAPVDDPCSISATSLTNAQLVDVYARTLLYVKSHKKGEDDLWYDHGNLLRRLAEERHSRLRLGHVWLGDPSLTAMPGALYELRSGLGRAVEVVPADVKKEAGKPGGDGKTSVMTPSQFNSYLEKQRIPSVNIADYFAKQEPGKPVDPLTYVLPEPERRKPSIWDPAPWDPQDLSTMFLDPVGMGGAAWGTAGANAFGPASLFGQFAHDPMSRSMFNADPATLRRRQLSGGQTQWRGRMPELASGRGSWSDIARQTDLNKIHPTFEVVDYRDRLSGKLTSVTHSLSEGGEATRWYDTKFQRAIGMQEPWKVDVAIDRLNTEYGSNMQPIDLVDKVQLAINDDAVEGFRTHVIEDVRANPGRYATLLDALLRKKPVVATAADGTQTTLRTWNELQNARATNTITEDVYRSTIRRMSSRAGDRVVGSGITTNEIRALQQFRRQNWNLSPEVWKKTVTPELNEAMLKGTIDPVTGLVKPGYAGLMKQSAKGGAKVGLGITAGVDAYRFATDPDAHPDMLREAIIDLGLGAAGSAGSAMIESGIGAYTSNALIGQTSRSATMLRLLGRGGGGLLGGLAAPAVTMAALMLDSEEHSRLEYYGAMARSGASAGAGGLAGALATGTYFAIAGSEFPLVGNAIGFGVGFGGALVFDAIWGEDIESGVREYGGELGCVDRVVPK